MATKQFALRGHHLYQLYKAYQLNQRGNLKIWDYLAKNFLCSLPGVSWLDVPDKVFGDTPEKIKNTKQTLDNILKDTESKIEFTNLNITDAICKNCPEKCPANGEYSGHDDYVINVAGLEAGKPYTLNELAKIFQERYEKWAGEYELACFDARRDPFFSWEGALNALRWKKEHAGKPNLNWPWSF